MPRRLEPDSKRAVGSESSLVRDEGARNGNYPCLFGFVICGLCVAMYGVIVFFWSVVEFCFVTSTGFLPV